MFVKSVFICTAKIGFLKGLIEQVRKLLSYSYKVQFVKTDAHCREINKIDGFPTAEEAYIEARRSFQPRAKFNWSHPIVYFTGKKIGWNNLIEKDTKENFNSFKKIFNNLKNEVINGKIFEIKDNTDLETRKPLNKDLFEKLRKEHKV